MAPQGPEHDDSGCHSMLRNPDTPRCTPIRQNGSPPSSTRSPRPRHPAEVVPYIEKTSRRSLLPALTHAEAHRRGSSFPECPGGGGGARGHGAPDADHRRPRAPRLAGSGDLPTGQGRPSTGGGAEGPESKNGRRTTNRGGRIFMILQVPHDAWRCRGRSGVGGQGRSTRHEGRTVPSGHPAGRAPPAPQRVEGGHEHRRSPPGAAGDLRGASGRVALLSPAAARAPRHHRPRAGEGGPRRVARRRSPQDRVRP